METLSLSSNRSDKSFCSLFISIATASFANPGPMANAKSAPVLPFGNCLEDPSGNVTFIFSIQFFRLHLLLKHSFYSIYL